MTVRKFALFGAATLLGSAVLLLSQGLDRGMPRAAAGAGPAMPAMPVPVAPVVTETVPVHFDYSARAEAINNLTLQAKVSAYLLQQAAPDGADVKAGDLLYRLDPRDAQAALDQAKAQAERDAATLAYSRSSLSRGTELEKSGYLAKDAFDQRTSSVQQAEAALAADRAAQRTAQLNFSYTEIRAPFAGRLGRNQAAIGTLVGAGTTVLNTLVQLDPIYVAFNPSETELAELEKARRGGRVDVDILMPGETTPSHKGELTFLDNVVDRTTGTITARASVPNPDFALLPGQYLRARVHVRDEPDTLMVPQTAVGSSQLGKFVYVVGKDSTAEQRFVSLGVTRGPLVSVRDGLKADDKVINGNLQKIGPGSPVQPLP